MSQYVLIGADLVAILLLTFGIYFRRHRRRDLVTAYVAVNAGVLAVTVALSSVTASIGLGLGLFGVLSIIRLRSTELSQHEVAYYFSALALGLLGGLGAAYLPLTLALMALIVCAMYLADHPGILAGYQHQVMILDRAITDEAALTAHLEQLLGGVVHRANVQRVDLIRDCTQVDVRFRTAAGRTSSPPLAGSTPARRPLEEAVTR